MAAQTVTVGCKVPNGIVCEFRGAIPDEYAAFRGKRVTLNGYKPTVVRHKMAVDIVGGFGLTHNVDAEFMAAWMKLHASFPAVKNGLIFVQANSDRARGHASERDGLRSGYEPLTKKDMPAGVEPVSEAA